MSNSIIVNTKYGKVRGIKEKSKFPMREYFSFYGIPYGQPPVDDLRFKDPVKVTPWKSVRDCTTAREGCIQFSLKFLTQMGSEDCLYVNVHIPELPVKDAALKAVVVQLHPGGYLWSSPDPHHHGSPEFAMSCDVINVNIGFRLHVLGFLNLGIKECSGNQGLKDIILALKWIQETISGFGGDPNNITLLGSSSGAALIHCLLLSPAAKNLFHKAVIMSGYLFNTVTLEQETNFEEALLYCRMLGYEDENESPRSLLAFLKDLSVDDFIGEKKEVYCRMGENNYTIAYPCGKFSPSVDRKSRTPVLPKHPRELIKSMNRVPIMVGNCQRESVMGFCKNRAEVTYRTYKTAFKQNCWSWSNGLTDQETDYVIKEIDSFYLKDVPKDNVPLSIKCDILDDAAYSDLYDTLIDAVSADLPDSAFVYSFEYVGEINDMRGICSSLIDGHLEGSFHADDFGYWTRMRDPITPQTKEVVLMFLKLVSSFAKTGNPNYEDMPEPWMSSTPENPCYLRITDTLKLVPGRLNNDRALLWKNIKKTLHKDKI
ncbi:esterase B1-like [Planococcus citri]|uniref:esterase B1-like n=1 Tax=Planococcus citri TaxID=170843 RepID=UPI0031F9C375